MSARLIPLLALLLELGAAQNPPPGGGGVRFRALDVVVDCGKSPLAAYQIEITCAAGEAKIAGVEGGEPKEFAAAPYYDPAALQDGRIIIAAFTTEGEPPAGRIRVARIHMQETGALEPVYRARLMATAAPGGVRFEAKVELVPIGGPK